MFSVRPDLPSAGMGVSAVARKFRTFARSKRVLGSAGALKVLLYSKIRFAPWELFTLNIPGFPFPVHGRTQDSDSLVLKQIFLSREYAPIDDQVDVRFVLDCGANAGYSSIYFLNRFPRCRVMAVEPDPANVRLLRKNLKPYGDRTDVVEAGVWSTSTKVVIERGNEAWATRVRAVRGGERGDVEAVDISFLLRRAGFERIDVLKMDIEGSEAEVFSANVNAWLPRVRTLVIELHGERAASIVRGALASYDCAELISGEVSIFRELKRKTA